MGELETRDVFIVFFLLVFSIASRVYCIWYPDEVVFDEVYFGNFTNSYITGVYYFDIHPELGKLTMALLAYLQEYDGTIDFENSNSFRERPEYVILRMTPALLSSFCVAFIYLSIRFLGFSTFAALTGSFFCICDTSMLTEQRFILSDGVLHFYSMLFVAAFCYALKFSESDKGFTTHNIIAGILLGMACSCKDTALGLCLVVALVEILVVIKQSTSYKKAIAGVLLRGSMYVFPLILVYLLSFYIHFILLPYTGDEYAWSFLHDEMREQLVGKTSFELWARRIQYPSLYIRTIMLSWDMRAANMGIDPWHPFESHPSSWPFLSSTFVLFWGSGDEYIACMGNPLVYYLVDIGIVLGVLFARDLHSIVMLSGWVFSYFPFLIIPRSMYLYHYIIPLYFACAQYGISIERAFRRKPSIGRALMTLSMISAFVGFVIWSHRSYGIRMRQARWNQWTDNWWHGDARHRALREKQSPEER